MKKNQKTLLWISGGLTAAICLVMNLVLIPMIEKNTAGLRCFDMNSFGYTFEQAKQFLTLLDGDARNLYLHVQLPLDFIYPVAYTAFFMLAITALRGKASPLLALPGALAVSDYIENVCSIKMLREMDVTPELAKFASAVTVTKSLLMDLVFVLLAVLFIMWLVKRKKK
jgi:hypothetical protein